MDIRHWHWHNTSFFHLVNFLSRKWRRMESYDAGCLSQLNHPTSINKSEAVALKIIVRLHRCLWDSDSHFHFRANLANLACLLDSLGTGLRKISWWRHLKIRGCYLIWTLTLTSAQCFQYICFHRECLVNDGGWGVMMQIACPSSIIQ